MSYLLELVLNFEILYVAGFMTNPIIPSRFCIEGKPLIS
jgi:hypothetical protein